MTTEAKINAAAAAFETLIEEAFETRRAPEVETDGAAFRRALPFADDETVDLTTAELRALVRRILGGKRLEGTVARFAAYCHGDAAAFGGSRVADLDGVFGSVEWTVAIAMGRARLAALEGQFADDLEAWHETRNEVGAAHYLATRSTSDAWLVGREAAGAYPVRWWLTDAEAAA